MNTVAAGSTVAAGNDRRAPLAGIEWLKLLASLGIVAFHLAGPLPQIGYGGLPVFTMITAAMAARSARATDWTTFRQRRLRRLLLPWLWWSACYAVARCLIAWLGNEPLWAWPHLSMLVIGTYPHLWYLPFAALLTLLIGRWLGHRGGTWTWAALGAVAFPLCNRLMFVDLPMPLPQWLFVTPAALFGLALASIPNDAGGRPRLLALCTLVLALCAVLWAAVPSQLSLPYAVATVAIGLAWSLPMPLGPRWQVLTSTSFGIYVLHMGVFMLLALAVVHNGLQPSQLQVLAATFGISLLLTLLLQRTPLKGMV